MKRRVKRYAEGEMVEGDEIPMDMEPRRSASDYMMNEPATRSGGYTSPARDGEESGRTFKQAFAEARRAGERSFRYGGKRYTTEMASEKKRVRSTAPTPDESAAETARLARAAKITEPKKSGDSSSAALLAIPAAAAAAAGMRRGIKEGSRRTRTEPSLQSRVKMQEIDPFDQMAMDRMTGEGGRKKGGRIKAKKMASGGSASSRGDGIAQRGKTRGRMC